jgi:hypothetical protein
VTGGSLDWVRPHLRPAGEDDLLSLPNRRFRGLVI